MTVITQSFASKLSVAFVAIAMMFMAVAPAQAQTAEELQAEIAKLMATINQLQSQIGQGATNVASGICPYTWTRTLTSGSTGDDVMKLQQFLNASEDTRVAATGAGSVGAETMYFGPATAAAVQKFQVKYRADILTPNGLVNPVPHFGPSTMAKANALCTSAPVDNGDGDNGDDGDMDNGDVELSGEASLTDFEIDDADDTDVEEGQNDVEIAEITVKFEDGDASISRLDIALTQAGADPWKAFEAVSLWVDGEMIAETDADSKSDYLGDEDDGVLRFSNLDIVSMDDEDTVIVVAATIQNNLDADELGTWTLTGQTIRFFDADGVATTESDGTPDLTAETATFDILVEGADDELIAKTSSEDPIAQTLILKDNKKESYVVFAFDLDTDDSTNDVSVLELTIDVDLSSTTLDVEDYINDAALLVDDDEVDAQDVTVLGSTILFEFDDGDFVIDAGERVTVELEVEFDALDSDEEGDSLGFSIDGTNIDAEGADEFDGEGSATGEDHIVITEGIVILADGVETETDTQGDNDTVGTFTIDFDVTAYENDFYISATSGVAFTVSAGTATTTFTVTSTGAEDTDDVFTVADGETETFTLYVTVDPAATGQFRVTLDSVDYSTDTDGQTGALTRTLSPATDFRTDFQLIQGS